MAIPQGKKSTILDFIHFDSKLPRMRTTEHISFNEKTANLNFIDCNLRRGVNYTPPRHDPNPFRGKDNTPLIFLPLFNIKFYLYF